MLKDQIYTLENTIANNRARLKEVNRQIEALSIEKSYIDNQQQQFQEILIILKAGESLPGAHTKILQEKYDKKLNEKLERS